MDAVKNLLSKVGEPQNDRLFFHQELLNDLHSLLFHILFGLLDPHLEHGVNKVEKIARGTTDQRVEAFCQSMSEDLISLATIFGHPVDTTKYKLAHRYAIFLCSLDVEI